MCGPQKLFSIKLRPAEHYSFGMWPADQFEFKTPDLKITFLPTSTEENDCGGSQLALSFGGTLMTVEILKNQKNVPFTKCSQLSHQKYKKICGTLVENHWSRGKPYWEDVLAAYVTK